MEVGMLRSVALHFFGPSSDLGTKEADDDMDESQGLTDATKPNPKAAIVCDGVSS